MKLSSSTIIIILICIVVCGAGCGRKQTISGNSSELFVTDGPVTPSVESSNSINKTFERIDTFWDFLHDGDVYFKKGDYRNAVIEYKKAYSVKTAESGMAGKSIIEAYERLGEFDEALAVVDDLEKNHWTAEIGKKRADEIRKRLLAEKAAAATSEYRTPSGREALEPN